MICAVVVSASIDLAEMLNLFWSCSLNLAVCALSRVSRLSLLSLVTSTSVRISIESVSWFCVHALIENARAVVSWACDCDAVRVNNDRRAAFVVGFNCGS